MKSINFCALFFLGVITATQVISQSCPNAVDFVDPNYGGRLRQLKKDDGHEHNIYYHRNVWNADNTYMIGVQSDLQQQNWRVVLYDGDGCYLKDLFPISQYDWRFVLDRNDPAILYTWKGSNLYRYNVNTGQADLLKSFAPLGLKPSGPSLNQAGDRILVTTSDNTLRSYRLPDMQEERAFTMTFPPGCFTDWEDQRYFGYGNYIANHCNPIDSTMTSAIVVYDDTGVLFHRFDGIGGGGHFDFSPNGQLAYIKRVTGGPRGGLLSWEIHVVNLGGSNDRVLYSVPQPQAGKIRNLHISWPDRDSTRFFVSFFANAPFPPTYVAPLDEILQVRLDGTHKFLARTGTDPTQLFWAQPLASPSSDGSRLSFNSNRSGTIDQYLLFVDNVTSVKDTKTPAPKDFSLSQNFPNPFWSAATSPAAGGGNPETTIAYELPIAAQVELQIYDVLGRKVAVLYSGPQVAGRHSLHWNAGRQSGGLYLYRLIAQAHGRTVYTQVKKLLLVK